MGFTVLVVEDQEGYAYLVRRTLLALDPQLQVNVAKSGQEALEKVDEQYPNLILLDLALPRLSGLSVLLMLKDEEKTRNIPVVILSELHDAETIRKAYDNHANAFLVKPTTLEELQTTLRDTYDFWAKNVLLQLNRPPPRNQQR